jgi:hypothetical protein
LLINQVNPVSLNVKALKVNGVNITGGGGNPNALVSTNSLVGTTAGAVVVFTGDESNLDCNSQAVVIVDVDKLRVNDVGSSSYSALSTDMGQTVLRNSGAGGVSIDGASGDILLTTTKFLGAVNIQSYLGLTCNGVGSINSDNNDLVVSNVGGDVNVASKDMDVNLKSANTGKVRVINDVGLEIVDRLSDKKSTIQTANTGDLNIACPAGAVNVNGFSGLNINADSGSISLNTVNNDVLVNTGTGKLSVLSGSQFDGQMTTSDIQVNSNSSLLLHDTTTGNSCEMYEDTTGYCEISNPDSINITVVNAGEYIKLSTGDSGFVEFNNSSVGSSAYVAVNADADFELYDNNKIVLSTEKGVLIKDIPSQYFTQLYNDGAGDFLCQNDNGDITINAGSAYFKSVKTNNNAVVNKIQNCQAFAVAGRPVSPALGECFFCLDIFPPRPLWYSGVSWVDGVGTIII